MIHPTTTSGQVANVPCQHCGFVHNTTCPRVKSIDYYQDGTLKHIEFHATDAYGSFVIKARQAPVPTPVSAG